MTTLEFQATAWSIFRGKVEPRRGFRDNFQILCEKLKKSHRLGQLLTMDFPEQIFIKRGFKGKMSETRISALRQSNFQREIGTYRGFSKNVLMICAKKLHKAEKMGREGPTELISNSCEILIREYK